MAGRKKKPVTLATVRLPSVRVDGAKRTNLAEMRKRREAEKIKEYQPVEDTRVAKVWYRQSRRDVAATKTAKQVKAMQAEKVRPRKMISSQRVKNPYFQPEHKITNDNPVEIDAAINIKESAVETMFARGVLDRAQKAAADKFRAFFEAMGGAGAAAMDYSKVVVDGGPSAEPLPERKANAGKELVKCRQLLGARLFALVCKVCGEGKALLEISVGKRDRLTAADNLRHALNDLADMWKLKTNRR